MSGFFVFGFSVETLHCNVCDSSHLYSDKAEINCID